MKNPVKLIILVPPIVALGLFIAYVLTDDSRDHSEAPGPTSTINLPVDTPKSQPELPTTGPQDSPHSPATERKNLEWEFEADTIAIPVAGNPLLVTLMDYPEVGEVSIENYNHLGKPTGEPLKSGTKIKIPNPNNPNESIRFIAP